MSNVYDNQSKVQFCEQAQPSSFGFGDAGALRGMGRGMMNGLLVLMMHMLLFLAFDILCLF